MGGRLSVFLCHASEDKEVVREIERRLRNDGFDPWLDEKKLLPGVPWEYEIDKAVRRSDAVVVCVSKTSVAKEGFVQRELRRALEIAEEKPEDTVFIIPVRLEECELPRHVARYQWADYHKEGGYAGLVATLQGRSKKLGRDERNTCDGERTTLLRAAEDGKTDAMLHLGEMYDTGKGVEQDPGAAASWYRAAAEAGDLTGMYEVGKRFAAGLGVDRNRQEAFRWFLRAAENGSAAGMTSVGIAYRRGMGVDRNDAEALRWFRKAVETGYTDAMVELGAMFADGAGQAQDDEAAVQWFQRATDRGSINGARSLAGMYTQGRGVPRDDRAALRLLRKAADAGDAPAMVLLGRRYLQHDHIEARRLFEGASSAGDPEGMRELANLYASGIGVPKDVKLATEFLEKAAANDDVESMRMLGLDCEANDRPEAAIRWYRQAGESRDEFSLARLKVLAGSSPVFQLVHTFHHTHEMGRIQDIALSADGRLAALCANYAGQRPSLWDAHEWKQVRRIKTSKDVNRIAFSSMGDKLGLYYHYFVKGQYGGSAGLFDLANDRLAFDCDTPGWYCDRLWFQSESLTVLERDPQGNHFLHEISLSSGTLKQLFSARQHVLAATLDTKMIAIRAEDGFVIEIMERETGKNRIVLRAPEAMPFKSEAAFSDDGKQFAAYDEEAVYIWDLSSGQLVMVIKDELTAKSGNRLIPSFSPDGTLLVIAPMHSWIRLWDAKTGELRQTITEEDSVEAFTFRPDGKVLITAHEGGRVRVWEAR